jgi:hypothetical protein
MSASSPHWYVTTLTAYRMSLDGFSHRAPGITVDATKSAPEKAAK